MTGRRDEARDLDEVERLFVEMHGLPQGAHARAAMAQALYAVLQRRVASLPRTAVNDDFRQRLLDVRSIPEDDPRFDDSLRRLRAATRLVDDETTVA